MKIFQSPVYFDSIVVIESLEEGHKTGRKLAYDDLYVHQKVYDINVSYCSVSNREELDEVFYKIDKDINYGLQRILKHKAKRPIIHIEAHGSKNGLELLNGEIYPWPAFVDWCRLLNQPMLNNLLVVLALCKGFESIRDVKINTITPYWGLIGSEQEVSNTLSEFSSFYQILFKTGNIQEAMKALDKSYELYLCEEIFTKVFIDYYLRYCKGQGKQERIEKFVTNFRKIDPTGNYSVARKFFRQSLKNAPMDFEKFKNRFLLADLPGNEERFSISFDYIEEFAQKLFSS